jgi:hypothetical protein
MTCSRGRWRPEVSSSNDRATMDSYSYSSNISRLSYRLPRHQSSTSDECPVCARSNQPTQLRLWPYTEEFTVEIVRPGPNSYLAVETLITPHCTSYLSSLQYFHEDRSFSIPTKTGSGVASVKNSSLDPNATSSYRPISNLSFISKLIERIVCTHFADHVSTSQLFPAQQSAYRAFHSTETAVLLVHNGLVCAIDNGQVSSLMLLDLSAAFDTVVQDILIEVLSSRFGVNGLALDWFRSYLSERTQTFIYQGKLSVSYAVSCSVPQGSILGPVEFIAYMEEITEVTDRCETQSNFYADDIQLYASCRPSNIRTVRAKLSDCAARVSLWRASRRLKLNTDKTEVTWFGSRANLAKLANQDCTLQVTSDTIIFSLSMRSAAWACYWTQNSH